MKIQPTNNENFNGKNTVIQYVKQTSYGKCIHGHSKRGYDYDVFVDNKGTGNVMYKLYYITKDNKWVKSFLRFFSNNKAYKEVKSENWL